jgi:hypothetical protein
VKRRSIVDAVAHEPDRVAVLFESQQNPVFLYWRHAREYARFLGIMGQSRVRHPIQILAGHDFAGFDAYLRADVSGDAVVVTGDRFDLNPILLQGS